MRTRTEPQVAPTTCSAYSARLGETLAGTAPVARAWLAIEQPGPWGARALTESHFDHELGAELNRRAAASGVRIAMIRRVGHHALPNTHGSSDVGAIAADSYSPEQPSSRRVLLASTAPGHCAVRAMEITDPSVLLDLDFTALGAGRVPAGDPHPAPVLLVCTNAKRDRCCAVLGRALALDIAEFTAGNSPGGHSTSAAGLELWESDHLGGHRFAPTAVVLPTGYVYGRLDAATALDAVRAAADGRVAGRSCRGRSTWTRHGQAADLALREHLQEFAEAAVKVVSEQPVAHAAEAADGDADADTRSVVLTCDGNRYQAVVEQRAAAEPRPESCGKAFGNPAEYIVRRLEKIG
jgi:hypothetical protein